MEVFSLNLSRMPSLLTYGIAHTQTRTVTAQHIEERTDALVLEEPLEIRIAYGKAAERKQLPIAVTMRTPGDDEALALGFLFTEGIAQRPDQVQAMRWLAENTLLVDLVPSLAVEVERLTCHLFTSSSCGVCGKASIDAVQTVSCYYPIRAYPQWKRSAIFELPARLQQAQATFQVTGGLHAAAFFDAQGTLLLVREDVGRHNAADKVIGAALRRGDRLPLHDYLMLVSGRASFELVQKAAMAGVPCLAAVGAPSYLAVEMAQSSGMTLIGFLRPERFNIYTHPERIL